MQNRYLIASKSGVSIYGKILNAMGKLGQYTVKTSTSETMYPLYKDAENRMNEIIRIKEGSVNAKVNDHNNKNNKRK